MCNSNRGFVHGCCSWDLFAAEELHYYYYYYYDVKSMNIYA